MGFYRAKNGFGTRNGTLTQYWFNDRWMSQLAPTLLWSETTQGVEWSAFVDLGYYSTLFRYRGLSDQDIHSGLVWEGVVFGHKSGSGIVDGYRTGVVWRIPLYRKFAYLNLNPDVRFFNDRDWDAEPGIVVGMDFMFWGGRNI
jgi:hypothetical protein